MLRLVRAEARLPDAAEQVLEGAVAEEIDAFFREAELHLLRGLLGHAPRTEQRLLARGQLRRLREVEIPLLDELLDDLIEQLGELSLEVGVALRVAGRVAAQHLQ